jgi:hypothetical protein
MRKNLEVDHLDCRATVLSTLPSAGVGAVLFLMLPHTQLEIIAMIGCRYHPGRLSLSLSRSRQALATKAKTGCIHVAFGDYASSPQQELQ